MTRTRSLVSMAAVLVLVGCPRPHTPHPLDGQSRYLCCNLRYEKTEITDVNYLRGTIVPFGTPVRIVEVDEHSVKFEPAGHPPLTLVRRFGRKTGVSMDQYLEKMFPATDPRPKAKPAGKKEAKDSERARTEKLVEQGEVDKGMTREQVLRAIGYPPPHRTPSLEGPAWTYWQNRFVTMVVYFDGDKVARVER